MRKLTMTILCGSMICLTAYATMPPTAKMTLHIYNVETGNPLNQVEVKTQFRPDKNKRLITEINQTDTNGVCIVEGPIDYLGISSGLKKEGYYGQTAQLDFSGRNQILNRWEPWNPTVKIKLRKKKNPVSMIMKRLKNELIPIYDNPIGFDLEKSDWIEPHGQGKVADFIFTASLVTDPKEGIRYILTFPNTLDGIQEFIPEQNMVSSYIFPYQAPTNFYKSSLSKYRLLKYPEIENYPANNLYDNKAINYIFRTRTKSTDDGSITSSNYGYIKGEIRSTRKGGFYFEYHFNPVPNERSLEYSGENLLKKK